MLNDERLTQADVDALNAAVRVLPVTLRDVNALKATFGQGLGGESIEHWFDTTNGGAYHPCIPETAVGQVPYELENRGDATAWDLYQRIVLATAATAATYEKNTDSLPANRRTTREVMGTVAGALERMVGIEQAEAGPWLQETWVDMHYYYDDISEDWILEYEYDPTLYEEEQ